MGYKLALLSNITPDFIADKLRRTYHYEVYLPSGFDTWMLETANQQSSVYSEGADAVFILLDGTECRSWKDDSFARERLNQWSQAAELAAERFAGTPVFVSTLDIRLPEIGSMSEPIREYTYESLWYASLEKIIERHKNVFFFDLKNIITKIGRNEFYSDKMWYMGSMPYSRTGIAAITKKIQNTVSCFFELSRKIIVLDLDNTLWGGVIGEDGIDNIELSPHNGGQRYYDFQRMLLEMKRRGMLLAINSKNNPEDVKDAFDNHPYMLLKWDDFVAKEINWESKAQNIKHLEQTLQLTEASFVFIDDNPIEREIVKNECPEVLVLDFPKDSCSLADFAETFYNQYLVRPRTLSEDTRKTEMYVAEQQRKNEFVSASSLNDYIKKLEIEADIHIMLDSELERTAQLCGKTNQFNLTTKRYTAQELMDMRSDGHSYIFTVHTKDKYGDSGLVAVLILRTEQSCADIDTFLMSCRVMGRGLENVIAGKVLGWCREHGFSYVTASYIPTKKNKPVEKLYDSLGFEAVSCSPEISRYSCELKQWTVPDISAYREILFSV